MGRMVMRSGRPSQNKHFTSILSLLLSRSEQCSQENGLEGKFSFSPKFPDQEATVVLKRVRQLPDLPVCQTTRELYEWKLEKLILVSRSQINCK